ncbi:hypothetical protein IQ249_09670 [Lusitaniella coriacea LEGE 07157]|uniref:Uncharacterized protein n=1 Tax=Lusitaniella coriacea LEGE 07157 TaxID=945747 RepID=A0A8J7ISH3_9CYAN|nr:hypothetical protein [Lusitaniella coriacea]MBE9116162.1 hypothetical protein [Lusitaniella coriacea LEGE 07157]
MSFPNRSENSILAYLFLMVLSVTVIAYLLRGFGILTFIPGGIIWLLILLSIGTGILYGVEKTRRF